MTVVLFMCVRWCDILSVHTATHLKIKIVWCQEVDLSVGSDTLTLKEIK